MPNKSPRLGTLDDAAASAGVHRDTIRRYIDTGQLTGYRLGQRFIRVDLDQVDQLLQPIAATEISIDLESHIQALSAARHDLTPEQRARLAAVVDSDAK